MGGLMSPPSFFEGPEKKVELVVRPGVPSLRSLGDETWTRIVRAAQADVLSVLRNRHCDSYLLSESSLFVFDDYCVMMTCGTTTLVDAIALLLREISADAVAFLVYERKKEHFPERQPTTFQQDASRLNAMIEGQALRFGDEHGHCVHVFHSTRPFEPESNDPTLEVLMHGIDERVAAAFTDTSLPVKGTLAAELGLGNIMPGFDTSEHVFEPAGYSLNALRAEEYYTIHVTPEEVGSYVSFETNHDFRGALTGLVGSVVEIFQPRAFDVVTFLPEGRPDLTVHGYALGDHVAHRLGGYRVTYLQYFTPPSGSRPAYELPV